MTAPHALVRVVIPTFNRAVPVMAAVDSVLAQTVRDIDLVVVDDGSTDDTRARLGERAAQDRRLRVLAGTHVGVSGARNLGLSAPGRFTYAAFLDSDDTWMPDHLRSGVALLEDEPEVTFVFGAFETVDRSGTWSDADLADRARRVRVARSLPGRPVPGAPARVLEPRATQRAMVQGTMCPCTSTVIVRRAAVDGVWFDDRLLVLEDVSLFLRLAATGCPWGFLTDSQAVVTFSGDNLTRSRDLAAPVTLARQEAVVTVCRQKLGMACPEDRATVRAELARETYLLGQCCAEQQAWARARHAYRISLRARFTVASLRSLMGTFAPRALRRTPATSIADSGVGSGE